MSDSRHFYIELGADLLAKPTALCDLIEAEGFKPTIVFCNLPSDTDLVKVILRKRNITANKLIGNVPPEVVKSAIDELKNGSVNVIIATDIGAQHIDMRDIGLVINYSIPGDSSSYVQRAGENGATAKVVSLVTPLDLINFFTLKKCLDHEVVKMDAPAAEVVHGGRFQMLVQRALQVPTSESLAPIVQQILGHESRDQIVSYLLAKNLEAQQGQRENRNGEGRNDRRRDGRSFQNDQRGGGRRSRTQMVEVSEGMSADGGGYDDAHQEPQQPVKKDVRYYIGHGTESGFSENNFRELLGKVAQGAVEGIQRFRVRGRYAFVDFNEAAAEAFEGVKDTLSLSDTEKLFAKKTVVIPEPRPPLFSSRRDDQRSESENTENMDSDPRDDNDSAEVETDADEVNFNR